MNHRTEGCPWDARDITKVFVFYFIMVTLGSPLVTYISRKTLDIDPATVLGSSVFVLVLTLITNGLSCLYVLSIVSVRHRQPISALGLNLWEWRRNLGLGLLHYLMFLPIIISAGFLVAFVSKNLGVTPQHQQVVYRLVEEKSFMVMTAMVVFGVAVSPVVEEVLFRGFLQPFLRGFLGSSRAIFLSAFFFALVHLSIYVFLQILVLGLLLAYLFEKTGTLVAPISIHMLHNSLVLSYFFFLKGSGGLG